MGAAATLGRAAAGSQKSSRERVTRGTQREHLVRATLESIAYQTRDVMDCVTRDSGIETQALRVDGGACQNDFLMQFQADVLGVEVQRPEVLEVTALGAAALAGLAVGFWPDTSGLEAATGRRTAFEPQLGGDAREALYADWKRAVERSRAWAED